MLRIAAAYEDSKGHVTFALTATRMAESVANLEGYTVSIPRMHTIAMTARTVGHHLRPTCIRVAPREGRARAESRLG